MNTEPSTPLQRILTGVLNDLDADLVEIQASPYLAEVQVIAARVARDLVFLRNRLDNLNAL